MIYGLSYLGGAKYPDVIAKSHPTGFAAKFFGPKVFGDPTHAIDQLLATGKCPVLMLQVCYRSDHNYQASDLQDFISYAGHLNPIIDKYPNVEFRLSPYCEHNIKDPAFIQQTLDAMIKYYHRPYYVNSPMNGVMPSFVPNNEFHGGGHPKTPHYQFDYDGVAAEDADNETDKANFSNGDIFFLWGPRFNGKWSMNDTTPIPQRTGWPDSNYINALAFLATSKGHTSLPNHYLYKMYAEMHNAADPKGGHPVIIIPEHTNEVILRDSKGNVIDVLPYYGPYTDGRHRYYSKNMGYNRAQKAIALSGSPLCGVFVKGKKIGVINPGFRENEYR